MKTSTLDNMRDIDLTEMNLYDWCSLAEHIDLYKAGAIDLEMLLTAAKYIIKDEILWEKFLSIYYCEQ